MIRVFCSLARCCVAADDADPIVSDNLLGFRLLESLDSFFLFIFLRSRELGTVAEKIFSELTWTLLFLRGAALIRMVQVFGILSDPISRSYGPYVLTDA